MTARLVHDLVGWDRPWRGQPIARCSCGYRVAASTSELARAALDRHAQTERIKALHPARSCPECGAPCEPGRRWCSTACHRADEPGAYVEDDVA